MDIIISYFMNSVNQTLGLKLRPFDFQGASDLVPKIFEFRKILLPVFSFSRKALHFFKVLSLKKGIITL